MHAIGYCFAMKSIYLGYIKAEPPPLELPLRGLRHYSSSVVARALRTLHHPLLASQIAGDYPQGKRSFRAQSDAAFTVTRRPWHRWQQRF